MCSWEWVDLGMKAESSCRPPLNLVVFPALGEWLKAKSRSWGFVVVVRFFWCVFFYSFFLMDGGCDFFKRAPLWHVSAGNVSESPRTSLPEPRNTFL